ncbi:MAG: ArsR/SmtB family transcription factor [Bacillota bacterium]
MKQEINFELNMAVEFLAAVYRYVNEEKVKKYNFEKNEELEEWIEEINNNISPFLENDLKIVKKANGIIWPLLKKSVKEQIDTPEEFFRILKEMDPDRLVAEYVNEMAHNIYEPGKKDNVDYIIKNYFNDKDKISFIKEIIKSPEELKDRLYIALNSFYRKFFKDNYEKTVDKLENKINEHQKMYEQNEDLFFNNMLGYEKDSEINNYDEINLIILWHGEIFNFSFSMDNKLYLLYGFALEQRINEDIEARKGREFFKLLADKKRFEILKLLSKKDWSAKELAEYFGITTSTISYHLSRLHDLGIISFKEGEKNRVYYSLKKNELKNIFQVTMDLIIDE